MTTDAGKMTLEQSIEIMDDFMRHSENYDCGMAWALLRAHLAERQQRAVVAWRFSSGCRDQTWNSGPMPKRIPDIAEREGWKIQVAYDYSTLESAQLGVMVAELDTGNLVSDPLYLALDALYERGWTDSEKHKHDPRGTNQWQAVLDLFRSHVKVPDASILKSSEHDGWMVCVHFLERKAAEATAKEIYDKLHVACTVEPRMLRAAQEVKS